MEFTTDKIKPLDIQFITNNLTVDIIGSRVYYYPILDSSNTKLAELAQLNNPNGTIVITDYQKQGRGKENRIWVSPANKNILFSILLYPPENIQIIPLMIPIFAVAICESIKKCIGIAVRIKWPNDLLIDGRKFGGILTEMKSNYNKKKALIIGIGLNINMEQSDFPVELQSKSTSLFITTGKIYSREQLFIALLYSMDKLYRDILEHGIEHIRDKWKKLSDMHGQLVRVMNRNKIITGYVLDTDIDGGILLRLKNGVTEKIVSGEIEIL